MVPRSLTILAPPLLVIAWALGACAGVGDAPGMPGDASRPAPLPDLAAAFGEPLHGFTPLAPALRGENDALVDAEYDERGRLVLRAGGSLESQPLRWEEPFDELLLSWNADVPAGAGLVVEVSVESVARGERSPWLYLGGWGATPPAAERTTGFDGGEVAVDVVTCERRFDAFRYRLRAIGAASEPVVVHASAACLTDTTRLAALDAGRPPRGSAPALAVPARSQRLVDSSLAPRICSPTSVAMVLAHHGVDVPLEELAAELYDADHDLYGNWPRAVQGAFARGVPGALVRLSSWTAVAGFLARDVPLVVSVKAEEGELRGAPYPRTSGHLLVLRGFTEDGRVLVNDPAAPDLDGVPRAYAAADLERCWMRRGGVAYAIGPRPR